jgi:GTPase
MTKEHLGICLLTGIPMLILFTKIDLVPSQITSSLIRELKGILSSKRVIEIKKSRDISFCIQTENRIIPFIKTSNKSGNGMPFLSEFLQNIVKRHPKTDKNIFSIEHIYNITGYGTVLSGLLVGKSLKVGDTLYMGPFGRNREFIEVKVKTLHNDYKNFIDKLEAGYRGCICIRYDRKYSKYIKKGMILTQNPSEIITCKKFKAKVKIFHHQTSIQPGYQAFANIGTVSENVKITTILNNENKNIEIVRNGGEAYIVFEFLYNYHYIEPGQFIIFREGSTRGVGQVTELL